MVISPAELARREGLSKAGITQTLHLTKLHPKIGEYLTRLTDQNLIRYLREENGEKNSQNRKGRAANL